MTDQPSISHRGYQTLLRNDLVAFIERSFREVNPEPDFLHNAYIEVLASHLEKCRVGKTKRLIINLPPRSLKSIAVSVAFVAWVLGHDPAKQVICASYGQDLADKHARDCRSVINSLFYRHLFPRTSLSPDKQSVNDFMTTAHGFRMATSVNGVLTGRGADLIILDDILKPDDALSEVRRRAANDWYFNTLLSRLNSKEHGVIIIVMQRLHQEDLVGEVLERESWEVLSLPAIATEDERSVIESPYGKRGYFRAAGQALHPERESLETLERHRQTVGEYTFQSQYQQRPISLEGGLIKREWMRYYAQEELPERFTYILQSWDTANSSGEFNDYSVCTTWGLYDQRFYLLDVFRRRLNYPALKRAVVDQSKRHEPTRIVIEEKSSGISLLQDLAADGVFGIEAYKPPPGSDKQMRLGAQSIKFEQSRVFLPRQAPWLDEYVLEITSFPGGKYDDQVDSTSQALDFLGGQGRTIAIWEALGRMYGPRVYETC